VLTEIGEAAVWLCSNQVSFVTGHPMVVDGGPSPVSIHWQVVEILLTRPSTAFTPQGGGESNQAQSAHLRQYQK